MINRLKILFCKINSLLNLKMKNPSKKVAKYSLYAAKLILN